MPEQHTILQIGAVQISDELIKELQDGRAILSVPRTDVRSVQVRYGFLSRHPLIQSVFGILLAVISSLFVAGGLMAMEDHRILIVPFLAGGFVFLGFWLVYDSLRRGHILEVWTSNGSKKFVLGRRISDSDLAELSRRLGL